MAPPVLVSFLIPAFNEEILVGRAVRSIHEAAAECGLRSYQIIVCDNASTDATAEAARAEGARVVDEPHRQIARARNAAAEASTGTWLVWLDADSVLTGAVLRGTLEVLASGNTCGGGARIELEGETLPWSARLGLQAWNWISRTFRLAAGSYFFALRGGWEATGGFNEAVYASEELGFSMALKRWGHGRGMTFRVLDLVVPSSARKIRSFTAWQMMRQMAVCAWPGNLGRRDRCAFWYERHPAS